MHLDRKYIDKLLYIFSFKQLYLYMIPLTNISLYSHKLTHKVVIPNMHLGTLLNSFEMFIPLL